MIQLNTIKNFEAYMYAVRNFSKEYIKNVLRTTNQFIIFLKQYKFYWLDKDDFDINFAIINTSDIYCYLFFLTNNYSTHTRNKKLIHIRLFFRYLYIIGKIPENIALPVTTEKTEKHESAYLSLEDAKKLLEYMRERNDYGK